MRQEVPNSDLPNPFHFLFLFTVETASMRDYVEYYVWFAKPAGSLFFATNQAVLEPYSPILVGTLAPDGGLMSGLVTATPEGVASDVDALQPPTLHTVETDLTARFIFFQGPNRIATEDELAALTSETTSFFTTVLQNIYGDLVRLDVELITAGFAEEADEPSVVSWEVTALFYVLDGTADTRTSKHLLNILATSDVETYLHNYVWKTSPLGGNLFFDTSAIQFEIPTEGSKTPQFASDVAATPPPSTDQIVVRATIQYGFLDDIAINRKPTQEEESGLEFQTSLFFNQLFREHFNDESFKQLTTSINDVSLVTGDDYPVIVSFELVAHFHNAADVPEVEELYEVMGDANFEEYIEFYVWSAVASADSLFFDTQRVVFQAVV